MKLSVAETMAYTTLRIETFNSSGEALGFGSSFIFELGADTPGMSKPIIVTNKHVVQNANSFRVLICKKGQNGEPIDYEPFPITWTIPKQSKKYLAFHLGTHSLANLLNILTFS